MEFADCDRSEGIEGASTCVRDEGEVPLNWSPKRMEEAELSSKLHFYDGGYYVLKNGHRNTYMRIGDLEKFAWNLLDGEHSVRDIVKAYYRQTGVIAYDEVMRFIEKLDARSMIGDTGQGRQLEDTGDTEDTEDNSVVSRYKSLAAMFIRSKFSFRDADDFIDKAYDHGGRFFYTKPATISSLLVVVFGFILFLGQMGDARHSLFAVRGSDLLGVIILALWGIMLMFVHECAHAFTLKHYGREVHEWGVMIYYGTFAPFTNTNDAWMLPKWPRIMVSLAGPYVSSFLGSLAAIVIFISPSDLVDSLFFKLSYVSFTSVLLNLNPLMEFDGYYALMDYMEIPNLRRKAFRFWREKLLDKIRYPPRLTWEEALFCVYGGLAGIWTVLTLCFALFTWFRRIDAHLLRSFGPYTKLTLVALVLTFPLLLRILQKQRVLDDES